MPICCVHGQGRRAWRDAGAGARAVGDVDGVDAGGMAQGGSWRALPPGRSGTRRQDLDGGDLLARRRSLRRIAALSGVARAFRPGACGLRTTSAARVATAMCCLTPLRRLDGRPATRMCSGVVPQHPPTPRRAQLDVPLGVLGEVLGVGQVEHASVQLARHARVRHDARPACSPRRRTRASRS